MDDNVQEWARHAGTQLRNNRLALAALPNSLTSLRLSKLFVGTVTWARCTDAADMKRQSATLPAGSPADSKAQDGDFESDDDDVIYLETRPRALERHLPDAPCLQSSPASGTISSPDISSQRRNSTKRGGRTPG
ncbi:hypothetical protein J7T55_000102, partial [Diaporthe amygdali]|uniref:uncharacterized protein n=1 Tax=Phomopsis amygdali TaxID=1214568 RepID=UPI0022FDE14E